MTKILFAVGVDCTPILATNNDAVKADIENAGADMDDHCASEHIMHLGPGLYVWEGERRENWICDELEIQWLKYQVRPATHDDLFELNFACPAYNPPG